MGEESGSERQSGLKLCGRAADTALEGSSDLMLSARRAKDLTGGICSAVYYTFGFNLAYSGLLGTWLNRGRLRLEPNLGHFRFGRAAGKLVVLLRPHILVSLYFGAATARYRE